MLAPLSYGVLPYFHELRNDPFYQLNGAQAQVTETDNHYIIQAEVPEHEKDNVKIFVHDDKAVIQGHRKFNDDIQDPEGRLTTNSFQTFRQEIPLDHPVREKFAHRSYENGILTLKIPKA
jgi:HSP20 family molecular chaperone IbpA